VQEVISWYDVNAAGVASFETSLLSSCAVASSILANSLVPVCTSAIKGVGNGTITAVSITGTATAIGSKSSSPTVTGKSSSNSTSSRSSASTSTSTAGAPRHSAINVFIVLIIAFAGATIAL
jgi:hypothetical protein